MGKIFNKLSFWVIVITLILLSFGFIQKAEAKPKHPLVGTWALENRDGRHPIVCYKLLKKNGHYVNLKSTDWDAKHFLVTRKGKFTAGIYEYVEHLQEEGGRKCSSPVHFPLKYEFLSRNTVRISYFINGQECNETWYRVEKAPKY